MARRRGDDEGSITRRKDGRWEARHTAHTASGPKRRVFYGKTCKEVADELARRSPTARAVSCSTPEASRSAGTSIAGSRTPTEEACARALTSVTGR
jgi:hypothetical protein